MSKLDGIKPGDRVRVTLEGVVKDAPDRDNDTYVEFDGGKLDYIWGKQAIAPTFHIEKIDPPLAVGDRVERGGEESIIRAIWGDEAWIDPENGTGCYTTGIKYLCKVQS